MNQDIFGRRGAPPDFQFEEDWLALREEPVIEPGLPIVDCHHHLWDRGPRNRYLLPELLRDIAASGHDVRATVYVQATSMYRADGDPRLACIGEVEFANGVAAMSASGLYGPVRACAGIVGHADLTLGAGVEEVLHAMSARAPDRFRGIRNFTATHDDPDVHIIPHKPPPHLLRDPRLREGVRCLARLGLSLDVWAYHPQLREVIDLADAFPDLPIVVDHAGARLGTGPYRAAPDEARRDWASSIRELARRPNTAIKLGGLGMRVGGFGFHDRDLPPTSAELAMAWRHDIEACIDAFGTRRAMFESNFPVDKASCSYRVVWNAFKRLAAGYTADEKADLFARTAVRIYRLDPVLGSRG